MSGRLGGGVYGGAEEVAQAGGGAEVGEHGEQAELQAIDEQPVGRQVELELVLVAKAQAVVDLGDEGVLEAHRLGGERWPVEQAHGLELVVEVEAALAADQAGVDPGAAEGGPVAVQDRPGQALPSVDETGVEALDAAEVEQRDRAVGVEQVVAGGGIGVVGAVVE